METQKQKVFYPVKLRLKERVKSVAACNETSFAVTEAEELLGWGRNDFGQVSGDLAVEHVEEPTKVLQAKGITVAAGGRHAMAYNKSNKVVSWGCNESGQCGSEKSKVKRPENLKVFEDARDIGLSLVKMACGDDHTIAIMNDSDGKSSMFAWGSNKYWQLTVESTKDLPYPFKTQFQGNVVEVVARHSYSMLITMAGDVFSWGSGEFGRLGYETLSKQQRVPRQIPTLRKVEKLALGIYHALAIDSESKVYSWGRGINGQLGHNNLNNQHCPKLVESLVKTKIIAAAAGEQHSVILGRGGQTYTTGGGTYGQLGLGEKVLRTLVPTKVELGTMIAVACGTKHCLALNMNGEVYLWGSNEFYQLAIKKNVLVQEQQVPEPPRNSQLQDRVSYLQNAIEQLKEAILEERRFKVNIIKFMQRNYSESAAWFGKFLRDL